MTKYIYEKVADELCKRKKKTSVEIAENINASKDYVRDILYALCKEGIVEREKNGLTHNYWYSEGKDKDDVGKIWKSGIGKDGNISEKIYEFLKDNFKKSFRSKTIAKRIGLSKPAVYGKLSELYKDGKIKRYKVGREYDYYIDEEALERAKEDEGRVKEKEDTEEEPFLTALIRQVVKEELAEHEKEVEGMLFDKYSDIESVLDDIKGDIAENFNEIERTRSITIGFFKKQLNGLSGIRDKREERAEWISEKQPKEITEPKKESKLIRSLMNTVRATNYKHFAGFMRDRLEDGVLSYQQFQSAIGGVTPKKWENLMIRISQRVSQLCRELGVPKKKARLDTINGRIVFY